nr:DUF4232 domain-containing protein [Pseudofrankia asymbiotica]
MGVLSVGAAGAGAAGAGAEVAAAEGPADQPVSRCASDDLVPAVTSEGGTAGTNYRTITYTYNGDRTCLISGYPTVAYVDQRGHQLGASSDRSGAPGAAVTLRPGGTTGFTLAAADAGALEGCLDKGTYGPAAGVRVTPPGGGGSRFIPLAGADACLNPAIGLLSATAIGNVLGG